MRVASVTATPVSVPYRRPEVSSQITREGVTDVIVRVETSSGLVGWGESFGGAAARTVSNAIDAMAPFVLGRSPWEAEAIRAELYWQGLWQFRPAIGNAAWAGIDTALWDICGQSCKEPLYHLLGGLRRSEATYFYYLSQGDPDQIAQECRDALAAGFETFYLKVGIDFERELEMIRVARAVLSVAPPPPGRERSLDARRGETQYQAPRRIRHRFLRAAGPLVPARRDGRAAA